MALVPLPHQLVTGVGEYSGHARRTTNVCDVEAPGSHELGDGCEHASTDLLRKSIGPIKRGLVLVVWTERADDLVRIISAWWATKAEQQLYVEYLENLR